MCPNLTRLGNTSAFGVICQAHGVMDRAWFEEDYWRASGGSWSSCAYLLDAGTGVIRTVCLIGTLLPTFPSGLVGPFGGFISLSEVQ